MNRWEKSALWARNFAPPLDGAVVQVQAFDIPVAQIITSFTTAIVLMPLRTGYVHVPIYGIAIRQGSAYATTPGANVRLAYSQLSGTAMLSWGSALLTTTTVGTGFSAYLSGIGATGGVRENVANDLNGALQIASPTGNPTVTAALPGSPITFIIYYMDLPTYPQNVGARSPLP